MVLWSLWIANLKIGDVVEIITKKDSAPRLKWLSIVKSNFARNKIKAWFNNLNKENNLKEGKRLVNSQLDRLGKALLDPHYSVLKNYCGRDIGLSEREHLLEEVGKGSQLASDLVKKIYPYEKNLILDKVDIKYDQEVLKDQDLQSLEKNVIVGGEEGLPVKIANCCAPRSGNQIIGFVTRGNRITIHKLNCSLLNALDNQRIIPAYWKGFEVDRRHENTCRVAIKILSEFRIGFIKDVSSVMASMDINIIDILLKQNCTYFLIDLVSFDQFDYLLDKLEQVKGVIKVSRVEKFR